MFGMSTTSPMMPPFGEPDSRPNATTGSFVRVCVLGSRESGKTCFIGGVGLLDKQAGWNVRADGRSMTRLDQIVTALSAVGSWLPGTQDSERYLLTVSHGRETVSIDVFDYPGQNFHRVIRACNGELDSHLLQHFLEADYLLLLVDPSDDPANTTNRTALIDAVKHRFLGNESMRKPQVAVVLTKADEIREVVTDSASATTFINERYPDFLPKLQSIVGKVNVFPVSAVGATDENGRPAIESGPTGYEPLLKWISTRPTVKAPKVPMTWPAWPAYVAIAAALACAVWLLPDYIMSRSIAQALNDTTASTMDRLDQTRDYHGMFSGHIVAEREKLAKEELDRLESAVRETNEAAPLRRVAEEARSAKARVPANMQAAFLACSSMAKSKAASLTFESLQRLKNTGDASWSERAQLFMDRYPDDAKTAVICDWYAAARSDAHKAARKKLVENDIDDPASCFAKAEALRRFLAEFGKYEPQRERQRIARAAEMAEMFSRKRDWEIHFVSAGELKNGRPMSLRVCNVDNDCATTDFDRATRITHSEEVRSLDWRPGQPLRVQLWVNDSMMPFGRSESLAATLAIDSPFAMVNLLDANEGYLELKADPSWRDKFSGTPTVRFRVGSLQPEDVRIVKEYLYPGTRWQ